MDERARIEALEAIVEALTARNEDLERALIGEAVFPIEWRLTRSEARVLGCLAAREVATKVQLLAALYEQRIDGGPEPKILDVFVCKLRRKLKPFGVEILTRWGTGYALANRAAVAERCAA